MFWKASSKPGEKSTCAKVCKGPHQETRFPTPEIQLPWLPSQTPPYGDPEAPKLLSHLVHHPGWLGFLNEVSVTWVVALSEVHMWGRQFTSIASLVGSLVQMFLL